MKSTDKTNVRTLIMKAAIQRYSAPAQIDKAIEELSELIRALARCDDRDNIAEEMADVRIMMEQLELIFENRAEVRKWELKKLKRLDKQLGVAEEIR